jgi:hypothetical protein
VKWLKALFREDSEVSMVRLMAILSLCIGGYLAIIGKDTSVVIFVGSAFAGKVAQKHLELSSGKTKISETDSRIES